MHVYISDCDIHGYNVIFGVPISTMVTMDNFLYLKLMLGSYIWRTGLDDGHTKVGVFAYDTLVKSDMNITFGDFDVRERLIEEVLNWTYEASNSSAAGLEALNYIEEIFTSNSSDIISHDPNIVFLILDRDTDLSGATGKADELRSMDIEIYVIAVGFTDQSTPMSIAYNQSEDYFKAVTSYFDLAGESLPFTDFRAEKCSKYFKSFSYYYTVKFHY